MIDISDQINQESVKESSFPIVRKVKTRRNYKLVNNQREIEKNFKRIQSIYIEDFEYLKDNYPNLFMVGTRIYFRKYEFIDCYQTKTNDYIQGKVDHFNDETKSFLIELINHKNNDSNNEIQIINIPIKDFIELFVEKGTLDNNDDEDNEEEYDSILKSKYGCLKRQVEYYFSDQNYYNDPFLLENLDENKCKLKLIKVLT